MVKTSDNGNENKNFIDNVESKSENSKPQTVNISRENFKQTFKSKENFVILHQRKISTMKIVKVNLIITSRLLIPTNRHKWAKLCAYGDKSVTKCAILAFY